MTETGTGLRVSMLPGAPIGGGLQHNQTASILAPSSGGANNVLMSTAEDPYAGLNSRSKNNTNQSSLIESMRKIEQPSGGTPGFSKVINTLTTSNSPYVGGRESNMVTANRAYSELQENDARNYSHNQQPQ